MLGTTAYMAAFVVILWLLCWIVPTFVALFEGMSLALPWSTQVLVRLAKFIRGWMGFGFLTLFDLTLPSLVYLTIVNAGYRVPFYGMVWRHTDRLG